MNGHGGAMNPGPLVLDRHVNGAGDGGIETLVTGNSRRVTFRQVLPPPGGFLIQQIENSALLFRFRFQELAAISERVHSRARR